MEFGKASWRTFKQGVQKEWLLTNGIGGFASSTVIGANTRRYHGLLIASLKAPVRRHLIFSKVDESVIINDTPYNIYTNQTPGHISKGYLYQQRFVMDDIPVFIYSIEDAIVEKKVCMVYGENKVVIIYKVYAGDRGCKLRITPLMNFRDYHFNSSAQYLKFTQNTQLNGTILKTPYCKEMIFINISEGQFLKKENLFYYNMEYARERERGLSSIEDHYIPGFFEIDVGPGEHKDITITAGLGGWEQLDGNNVIQDERLRINNLVTKAGYKDGFANILVKDADHFIVKRESTGSKTIIAGYPWFTDWGRDTMIALPGLTLVTKRYEDAKEILYTFSKYIKNGLIPNMFPDTGQEPIYNTVDAALWYIYAVYKYLKYTGDCGFVKTYLYEELKRIIDSYRRGTINSIKADSDGLIYAGSENTQLTWMDAKVSGRVITPRYGKAVEINSLWYNTLNIMAYIAEHIDQDASAYLEMAKQVKASFEKKFWNEEKQCLYDVINEKGKDGSIRPNQIFAVSLDFAVIDNDKAAMVVEKVWKQLYTTYGLRSLSPTEKGYRGIYIGDTAARDEAYHQGTAWSWLIGHFITAYRKVNDYSEKSRDVAYKLIEPFKDHMRDACIGSVSEIFDGDLPNRPRGCFAQAWGVAEVLRAYVEDVMQK